MHDITENVADQTDHFVDVFVRENVAYGYEVVPTLWRSKFTADAILLRTMEKGEILMFQQRFQSDFGWNKKNMQNNDHTSFFIELTLIGSLGRFLSARPISLVFKQLPRDPANVNA